MIIYQKFGSQLWHGLKAPGIVTKIEQPGCPEEGSHSWISGGRRSSYASPASDLSVELSEDRQRPSPRNLSSVGSRCPKTRGQPCERETISLQGDGSGLLPFLLCLRLDSMKTKS